MRKAVIIIVLFLSGTLLSAQAFREFSRDTGRYVSELTTFTGNFLKSSEIPDFQRFLHVYDSLEFQQRMEIIDVSNLMLMRRCRPRPHFITYERIMMEFFTQGKTSHGYDEWLEGILLLLKNNETTISDIDQWLSTSLKMLDGNMLYESNNITWSISTPSFRFQTEETMRVIFDDVTIACHSGNDSIQIMDASGYADPLELHLYGTQ